MLEINLEADINNIAFLEYMREQEEKKNEEEEFTVNQKTTWQE